MKQENVIGKTYHMLTVTDTMKGSRQTPAVVICDCECGATGVIKRRDRVLRGEIKSCGCAVKTAARNKRAADFPIGDKFGMLTLVGVEYRPRPNAKGKEYFKPVAIADCDCGAKNVEADWQHVKRGATRSCGCGQAPVRHGHAANGDISVTYSRWKSMMSRVRSTKEGTREHYLDRGIEVCDRWVGDKRGEGFTNFLADMGECPEGLTLDRINNDIGYQPDNCRWATWSEQVANRRYDRENSPYKNVFPYGKSGWKWTIAHGGEISMSSGTFKTPKDAALAHNRFVTGTRFLPIKEVFQ